MTAAQPPKSSVRLSSDGFYELVEQLVDIARKAPAEEVEVFLAAHPKHADRLLEVLPALKALAEFSDSGISIPPALAPEPGLAPRILGDFEILQEIGRGGMGVVYEARQISLRRRVALKALPFAAMLDSRRQQRFQNEALAAARLRHPHIVGVYSVGCERGVHYYAMEFVEGHTLADLIREIRREFGTPDEPKFGETRQVVPNSSLQVSGFSHSADGDSSLNVGADGVETATSPVAGISTEHSPRTFSYYRQIAQWGRHIAEALEYAHSVGVIHRDIKPSNILLDNQGHVWITDFGLAQISQSEAGLTITGDILGTLRYMSPEQAQGDHRLVDHRTDLYSLGITLYELLTGRAAFPETDRARLFRDVIETDPKPPRQVDPAIPHDLETIVLKAICKEPAERYGALQDLANDLQRFLNHEPIKARRPSLKDRIAKWSRRHRGLVLAVSLLSLLLMLVIGIAAVFVIQERGKRFQERQSREYESALAEAALKEERAERLQEQQAREFQAALAKQGEENARNHRYVSNIQLAWQAWNRSQVVEMKEHLLRCLPEGESDLRSWEWHYLWRLCHELPKAIGQHQGQAYFMVLSPDESLLASCGEDGVRFWDTETLKQVKHLNAHRADVNWVSFSPDGKFFATASDDHTAKVWETENWSLVQTLTFENWVLGAEFSPDGKTLAVVERGGQPEQNRINLFTTETWDKTRSWQAHTAMIHALSFSPDSKLLTTSSDDRHCIVWDLDLPNEKPEAKRFSPDQILVCVSFLPDGKHIVVANMDDMIIVWNFQTGQITDSFYADKEGMDGLIVTPAIPSPRHGQFLVSVSRSGAAKLWQVDGQGRIPSEPFAKFLCPTGVRWAQVTTKGQVFTADRDGKIRRSTLEEANGRIIKIVWQGDCPNATFAFLRGGERVVQGECGVYVYDTHTGGFQAALLDWRRFPGGGGEIAVTPNGTRLAIATPDVEVQLWDALSLKKLRTWTALEIFGDEPISPLEYIGFSSNGKLLFLFLRGRDTLQLNVQTGEVIPAGQMLRHYGWSPDGKYRVQHNGMPPTELREVATGKAGPVTISGNTGDADWTLDGRFFATVTWGGVLDLWETADWTEVATFQAAPHGSDSLAFSTDGRTIAVADNRGDIHLWNVATQRELFRLHFPVPYKRSAEVSFSRNGKSLGAAGYGSLAEFWIWNAAPPKQRTDK